MGCQRGEGLSKKWSTVVAVENGQGLHVERVRDGAGEKVKSEKGER